MSGNLPSKKDFLERIAMDPIKLEINFSEIEKIEILAQEILECSINGVFGPLHKIKQGNIVQCRVDDFGSLNADLEYVDFKDSSITNSNFKDSSFDYAAFINCNYENVQFEQCHFHNVSITGCEFYNVTFLNCKLDHMVIESCKFYNCNFFDSTTSNKLFEICLFTDCRFDRTDIQIQTILDNFGLSNSDLIDSKIRSKTVNEDFVFTDPVAWRNENNPNKIQEFRLEFFVSSKCVLEGSEILDRTFALGSWLENARIPSTFNNQFTLFHEFLIELYDTGKSTLFPLIKLHALSSSLINAEGINKTVLSSIYGVHMTLSRFIERFLDLVVREANSADNPIVILVNGPVEPDYYMSELDFIFNHVNLSILKVKKHNSPNELLLSWDKIQDLLPLISLLLATRLKFELKKIENSWMDKLDRESIQSIAMKIDSPDEGIQKFSFDLGVDSDRQYLYGLKLKSIFPGGLFMEFGLHISTKKISVLRQVLVEILKKSGSESQ